MSATPLEGPVLDLGRLVKGDRVGISSRGYENTYATGTVYRTTKTQVVVNVSTGTEAPNHRKFRLSDGGEVGVSYGGKLVHPDDPGLLTYAIRRAFDEVYNYAERAHRTARNAKPRFGDKEMARYLSALSEKIAEARAKIDRLRDRLPGEKQRGIRSDIARLACTDCTRETTNLVYQGRWCRELPDSNDGCPGFLLAVLAVPDGQ